MGLDEEEEAVVRDTGKKSKHSKKNKMNDLEENSLRLSKEGEEKKRKKKHVVSGDIKDDSALHEDGNGKDCEEVDGDVQKEKDQKKKKKKRKLEFGEDVSNCKDAATIVEENVIESSENDKKKKKKKEKQDVCKVAQNEKDKIHKKKKRKLDHDEDENEEAQMEGQNGQKSSEKEDIANINNGGEGSKEKKSKKEKKKKTQDGKDSGKMREENVKDNDGVVEKKRKKEKKKDENDSENPKAKEKKPKKVSFSSNVEVFPAEEELVRGKRFSKEEDEKVKEAVHNYIETHNLGEEGLNKVLNCSSHRGLKNCWKEIGAAIPYRPFRAIYYRAHILFERGETRKWTQEEYEFIKKAQEKHGNNWKLIADELGKHRFHVKDTWRRIKLPNMKKGHWSQEEYQTLFDLVNTDLQMKASEEKKSKHGMLRDNICWGAISDKLSTRSNQTCCIKWYTQLTSSMVEEGIWADVDDYRLLDALFNLDACCVEDVDWDRLLEHRPGEVCRKRWDQMVLHIGQHGLKSFGEQVDILAKRYCPDLVEVREEWDSKPVVD